MKFKPQDIVIFTLTNQRAMILNVVLHEPGNIYSSPVDGYLIRLDNTQEVFVREFELTEVDGNSGVQNVS